METKVVICVFVLFAALCLAERYRGDQDENFVCAETVWEQINKHPVCFEGKGDKPGVVKYSGCGKIVDAIKLVYKSGFIRCVYESRYNSRWGCHNRPNPLSRKYPLNVIITDSSKNRIFPLDKYFRDRDGLWYFLPFIHPLDSNELVFTDNPFYLPRNGTLNVWYGEDLVKWTPQDNYGRVCIDVFIQGRQVHDSDCMTKV